MIDLRAAADLQRGVSTPHVRAWRQRRRSFVNWLKAQPCQDCGRPFPPYVMDFDHRPGVTKVFSVAHWQRGGLSLDDLQHEVGKCDVVCANCHRMRTHGQRRVWQ